MMMMCIFLWFFEWCVWDVVGGFVRNKVSSSFFRVIREGMMECDVLWLFFVGLVGLSYMYILCFNIIFFVLSSVGICVDVN